MEAFLRDLHCGGLYLRWFDRCHLIEWVALPACQTPPNAFQRKAREKGKPATSCDWESEAAEGVCNDFLRMFSQSLLWLKGFA